MRKGGTRNGRQKTGDHNTAERLEICGLHWERAKKRNGKDSLALGNQLNMKTGAVGKGGYVKVNLAMDSLVNLSVDVNFSREERNTFLNVKSNPIKSLKLHASD